MGKLSTVFVGKLSTVFMGKLSTVFVGKLNTIVMAWQIEYRFCRKTDSSFCGQIEYRSDTWGKLSTIFVGKLKAIFVGKLSIVSRAYIREFSHIEISMAKMYHEVKKKKNEEKTEK